MSIKSNSELYQAISEGDSFDYLYFWGHTKPKSEAVNKACFSQWYEGYPVVEGENTFATAEHYMMWRKAKLFNDNVAAEKCLKSTDPREVKAIGRSVRNYDDKLWSEKRYDAVCQGNMHKFSQHPKLKEYILSTDYAVLVEASPYDKVWGIGLNPQEASQKTPHDWKGMNLLGYALMEVRDWLR